MPDATQKSPCPPEADLMAYCESRSTEYFVAYVEAHIVLCAECARKIAEYTRQRTRERQNEPVDAPDPATMVYVRSYTAAVTPDHILTVGRKSFGWDVVVQGTHPLRLDYAFHSDNDAKERGYEIARQHLVKHGARGVADFDDLQWDEQSISADGGSS
jgi:hypothetical protein